MKIADTEGDVFEKVWVGVGYDGKPVNGGHNRQRIYFKSLAIASKWATQDNRVVALIEYSTPTKVWTSVCRVCDGSKTVKVQYNLPDLKPCPRCGETK